MFPAPFSIRDKFISPGTVLAPMAGVTDTVFRRMIRSLGGCGLIMTEFTSAECITRNSARTSRYLFFEPDEHPITGQLFGAAADVMRFLLDRGITAMRVGRPSLAEVYVHVIGDRGLKV